MFALPSLPRSVWPLCWLPVVLVLHACASPPGGHGEFFIRYTVARDICARLEYQGLPLEQAASAVVMDELVKAGAEGGVIAMDSRGHLSMPFNSPGMYRGYVGEDGTPHVAIFQDE